MPAVRFLRRHVNGVAVVSTPAEVDITCADQLDAVVRDATRGQQPRLVVDMTRTRFCDSAGLQTVIRASRRILADGGELRLVIRPDGAVSRIITLTGADHVIACFASLEEALAPAPAGPNQQPGTPGPDAGQRQAAR